MIVVACLGRISVFSGVGVGGVSGNVFHFTTAAPVPNSGGLGGISGLNLSTNNGLDLSLPNYEGLDLSSVTSSATNAAAAAAVAVGGTSKRQQQRHLPQQQQQQQPGQQLVGVTQESLHRSPLVRPMVFSDIRSILRNIYCMSFVVARSYLAPNIAWCY